MGWKEDREREAREAKEAEETSKPKPMEEVEKELLEAEESETLKGFKARREAESNRLQSYLDSRFYYVVCFNNREQMNESLQKIGLPENTLYVDGHVFMKLVGQIMENPDLPRQRMNAPNKDWANRSR